MLITGRERTSQAGDEDGGRVVEHYAYEPTCRIVAAGQVHTIGGQDTSTDLGKLANDDFLHHKVARKAVCALHDDGADAVALKTVQESGEAGTIRKFGRSADTEIKSQNDFHRSLESSHRTRASHIPTSRFLFLSDEKTVE